QSLRPSGHDVDIAVASGSPVGEPPHGLDAEPPAYGFDGVLRVVRVDGIDAAVLGYPAFLVTGFENGENGQRREHLGNEHEAPDVRLVLAAGVPALEQREGWCAQTLLDDGLSPGGHVAKKPVAEPAGLAGQHVDAEG